MQSHTTFRLSIISGASIIAIALVMVTFRSAPAQISKTATSGGKAYSVAIAKSGQQTATFAGGCFWSLEAMFKQLKGVASVQPGYAGGNIKNPSYEQVGTAQTGHSETINVIYDPKIISYRDLVRVFLMVHDPTTLDRQGADTGPQYRSRIFYRDATQKTIATQVVAEVDKSKLYNSPIVTKVEPYTNFYRAEDYHLNYYNQNPKAGYCVAVIGPKLEKFHKTFKHLLKK